MDKLGFPGENYIAIVNPNAVKITDITTETKTVVGVKYDGEKPRMELLPPRSLKEVSKVLTFGAKKYAPDNWKKLDNLRARYIAGALRHITDEMIQEGHKDEESGIDGIAHAICCLMFVLEKRLEDAEKSS